MKSAKQPQPPGKITSILASIVGLALVWSVVWANLPSREELLSEEPQLGAPAPPPVPELDLTIPGAPPASPPGPPGPKSGPPPLEPTGGFSVPGDIRAKKIAEIKCDAEVQQACPESLTEEDRQQCMAQRMKQLSVPCQHIARQRMVRWKEAGGYKVACSEDVKRVCEGIEPGDGNLLACLQGHEQDLSVACYQSLPKGQLHLRN